MILPAREPHHPGTPRFAPGDLVRHSRYGYRGVVVDLDAKCRAADAWYYANQTQPDRDQPWYHVLVHGRDISTYAAQDSLNPDLLGEPVSHPWIEKFFCGFEGGCHIRNDTPWEIG